MSKLTVFERALVEAVLDEYIDMPDFTEIQYEPSESFKNAIKKIMAGFDKSRIVAVTVIKRLILVAIIAALLAGCALAIPAVREYLLDYFLNDHGSWYGVTFDPEEVKDAPHEIETFYAPTYVPEGYIVDSEMYSVAGSIVFYKYGESRYTCFYQYPIREDPTDDDWMGINADNTTHTSKVIDGYVVEIIQGKVNYVYIWTDNKYLYWLDCDIELPESEAVKMLESMDLVPEEKLNQP